VTGTGRQCLALAGNGMLYVDWYLELQGILLDVLTWACG